MTKLEKYIKEAKKLWDESQEDMSVIVGFTADGLAPSGYAFNGGKLACILDDDYNHWYLIGPTDEGA